MEEFNKIKQEETFMEYQEGFEELKLMMLKNNPHLSEMYFFLCFISGLSKELRPMIKLYKLQMLNIAYEQTQLQSQHIKAMLKGQKSNQHTVATDLKYPT